MKFLKIDDHSCINTSNLADLARIKRFYNINLSTKEEIDNFLMKDDKCEEFNLIPLGDDTKTYYHICGTAQQIQQTDNPRADIQKIFDTLEEYEYMELMPDTYAFYSALLNDDFDTALKEFIDMGTIYIC